MFKLAALATLAAFACAAGAATTRPFTSTTAPDAAGRLVLAHPLQRIDQGILPGAQDPSPAIHANFAQIVEQNFARLDSPGAGKLVDNLSNRELHDLAQLYVNSVADTGHQARLLDVLASRLDSPRLTRLSKFFGYADVDAAIVRSAPSKESAFSQASSPAYAAPVAGAMLVGAAAAGSGVSTMTSVGQFLDMTPNEIYLDFRTAPVGAMGVSGALFETGVVMYGAAWVAFWGGYYAGTAFANLCQTYDLPLWDQIVNIVGTTMTPITTAVSPTSLGSAQKNAVSIYQVTSQQYTSFDQASGDYQDTAEWTEYWGGGSGGCRIDCSPEEER
jgi:hypothetical protein